VSGCVFSRDRNSSRVIYSSLILSLLSLSSRPVFIPSRPNFLLPFLIEFSIGFCEVFSLFLLYV